MNKYHINDFIQYYGGSYILHPSTEEVCQVIGKDGSKENHVILEPGGSVSLEDLDWKHVKTPPLGYRGLNSGRCLYYITRRAGRRSPKGVTPEAIVISIPGIIRQLTRFLYGTKELAGNARLPSLAKEIHKPTFYSIPQAIEILKKDALAVGLPINGNWAVTLGAYKSDPFLLHFKNMRVASSKDGASWKFVDKDSESLFNSSMSH